MALAILTSTLTVLKNLKDNTEKIVKSPPQTIKSRLKLVLLSGTVCGIEFCYAAETAFVSPILLTAGVPMVLSTIIWCLSPLLGFFLVPILGSLSDNCKSIIGRRRPFIIMLSLGIVVGLVLVPYGAHLGENEERWIESLYNETAIDNSSDAFNNMHPTGLGLVSNVSQTSPNSTLFCITPFCTSPASIALLVIGIVMLDFCCDACQSPCRAYLLDVTTPGEHATGLTTFTIMAGLGGSVGYILGGIDWSASYGADQLTSMQHIRIIFTVALVMYVILTIISLSSYQEVATSGESPTCCHWLPACLRAIFSKKYKRFENEESGNIHSTSENGDALRTKPNETELENAMTQKKDGHVKPTLVRADEVCDDTSDDLREDAAMSSNKPAEYGAINKDGQDEEQYGDHHHDHQHDESHEAATTWEDVEPGLLSMDADLKTYLKSIIRMPKTLVILCVTNLLCWMSLVCYSLYFTNYVGVTIYGGDPEAKEGTVLRKLYNQGVRHGSLSMALYSFTCSLYSMALEYLVKKFGARTVYICSQLVYTLGSAVMAITGHKIVMLVFSCTAGIMYATLFTMPYIIIAHYHSKNKFAKTPGDGETPMQKVRGLGTDIGIVSSMVFVAQFLLSLIIGSIIDAVKNPMAVVVAAGILSLGGSISASQVYYGSL